MPIRVLAAINVLLGILNHFQRNGNARIAAPSQPLNLSDRGGTLVEVVGQPQRLDDEALDTQ